MQKYIRKQNYEKQLADRFKQKMDCWLERQQ